MSVIKSIAKIIEDFLDAQESRFNPKNHEKYLRVMKLFQDYVNYDTYQLFDEEEIKTLHIKEFLVGKKIFCEHFGPDRLDPFFFGEFIDKYMKYEVLADKSLMKAMLVILKEFVEWLFEHNYMTNENFQESFNKITGLSA